MKIELPEPKFWPLSDLAAEWGCSVERIWIFANFHGLQTVPIGLPDGTSFPAVTRAERERFENEAKPQTRPIRRDALASYTSIVGAFIVTYWGGDNPDLLGDVGRLVTEFQQMCANNSVPVLRADDTLKRIFREGIEQAKADGWKPPRRKSAAAIAAPAQSERGDEFRSAA